MILVTEIDMKSTIVACSTRASILVGTGFRVKQKQ